MAFSPIESLPLTIHDELDRLEVPAGKIGLNTAAQSFRLLHGLDAAYERIQQIDPNSPSRKIAEAQFDGIVLRMRKEAGRFIRDLGGAQALQQARAEAKASKDHWWWYLDEWVIEKRRAAVKRSLVITGIVVVALAALVLVYQKFLAPDPKTTASYGYEQTASDMMINGDYNGAMKEVENGLQVDPKDPSLLTMKGVLLDRLGQIGQSAPIFSEAEQSFGAQDTFLVTRGQDYLMVQLPDKALADAQAAVKANPQSANAYLLLGQVYEVQKKYQDSLDAYNKGYDAADKSNQPQLAALARMRIAMLMQSMNEQVPAELQPTATP